MKKILLLSDLSRDPDRQTIQGIVSNKEDGENWKFYYVSPFLRTDVQHIDGIVKRAADLGVDAVFGSWPAIESVGAVGLDIPVILKPCKRFVSGLSSFSSDSEKIGRMAADFFHSVGCTNLSFGGMPGRLWSSERRRYFRKYARGKYFRGIEFSDSQMDYDKVLRYLRQLPKPVGIFCCNDANAGIIIEICAANGIAVPDEVAVLGVDDDKFLCNISSPTISSIRLDYEKAGYLLASRLIKYYKDEANGPFEIRHYPVEVVERGSTPSRKINDPYVQKVISFMDEHFSEGIGISDAIAPVALSRRSIEIRFKKAFGNTTMLEYLISLKMGRLKQLLLSTSMTLEEAALRSGFRESENIYRLFKKQVGCTPAEYRTIHSDAE